MLRKFKSLSPMPDMIPRMLQHLQTHTVNFQSAANTAGKKQIKNSNFRNVRLRPDFFYAQLFIENHQVHRRAIQEKGVLQIGHLIIDAKIVFL